MLWGQKPNLHLGKGDEMCVCVRARCNTTLSLRSAQISTKGPLLPYGFIDQALVGACPKEVILALARGVTGI
jgi:hypothetical protein